PATQPPTTRPRNPDQPPMRPMGGGGFGGANVLNDFLKEEGAAALLIDSGKPQGLLNMTGSWARDGSIPEDGLARLFITHDHLTLLYRLIKEQNITPIVEVEVKNTFVKGPITCYNTVGDIVGSEKPDEIVLLGAHLDSWDLGTGSTDNGTGTSVVLECARALGKLAQEGFRPKRTIRCVLFTGEEEGLHGSKQYCIRHKDELTKHDATLVHDTGTGKVNSFGALGRVKVQQIMADQFDSLKEIGFIGLTPRGMAGGTDHASFNAVGVPGFACEQDPDEYRWTHHTQTDTFDKVKGPNLVEGAQVMAVTALRIANLPEMLPKELPAGGGRGGFGGGRGGRGGRGGEPPAPPPAVKPPDKKGGSGETKPGEKKG
ncbi:MAG TPA: M28 family peptidase, partial [Fimbriiglobus sp.]